MEDEQRLWTLQVTGSGPFMFQAPGNPTVEHEGGTTVAHLVLTQGEIGKIKLMGAQAGCTVKAWPMEGQTQEQAEQRAQFVALGDQRGEPRWAHVECPMCPWFDPLGHHDPCGLKHLPGESVVILRETSEAHRKAVEECPERRLSDP
jgi:hypothetical protein